MYVLFGGLFQFHVLKTKEARAAETILRPVSIGNFNQWLLGAGSSPVDAVDDPDPHDGDATYMWTRGTSPRQTFGFPGAGAPVDSQINYVRVAWVARKDTGLSPSIARLAEKGTAAGDQSEGVAQFPLASYTEFSEVLTVNPWSGSPWSVSEVNTWVNDADGKAIKFGVRSYSRNMPVRITQIEITVNYSPAGPPVFQPSGSLTSLIIDTSFKTHTESRSFVMIPNGDGGVLQWIPTPSGSHYTTIDDGVMEPSVPNLTDYLSTNPGQATDRIPLGHPTNAAGTEITVKIWVYAATEPNSSIRFSLTDGDVSNLSLARTTIPQDSPLGWYASATTTWRCAFLWGSCQEGLDFLRIMLEKTGGGPAYVYAAYVDLEYTALVSSGTAGVTPNSIFFLGVRPVGTEVKFQIASSNATSGPWSFVGWNSGAGDCDSFSYYTPPGPGLPVEIKALCHENHRYLRYRLFLETSINTITPQVDDVFLNYAR